LDEIDEKTLLLKEKETMERKFPNHTFSCAQNFRRWSKKVLANLHMRLAQQVSLCSGRNKRHCSRGAIKQAVGG
jgi:hypothetical protein